MLKMEGLSSQTIVLFWMSSSFCAAIFMARNGMSDMVPSGMACSVERWLMRPLRFSGKESFEPDIFLSFYWNYTLSGTMSGICYDSSLKG